jgi:hypothetical protein
VDDDFANDLKGVDYWDKFFYRSTVMTWTKRKYCWL